MVGEPDPIATTDGGVQIRRIEAGAETTIPAFPGLNAVDQNDQTFWGIGANLNPNFNIAGTTFFLRLDGEQAISSIGISNGSDNNLGRIGTLRWATNFEGLEQ